MSGALTLPGRAQQDATDSKRAASCWALPGLDRPAGGFRVILADPPWHYEMYSAKGEAKAPQAHYGTMPLAAICAMPVGAYAAADAALFLWSTWPTALTHAAAVIAAWGFTPKTGLPWIKRTAHGKVAFGPGYIGRGCSEPLFVATRGSPAWHGTATRLLLDAVAEGHSVKPDDVYTLVETIQHATPRLELFARRRRAGWVSWGDGIEPQMHWEAQACADHDTRESPAGPAARPIGGLFA